MKFHSRLLEAIDSRSLSLLMLDFIRRVLNLANLEN
jgi:hypothetical protein